MAELEALGFAWKTRTEEAEKATLLEDSLKLVILNCEFTIKLIYLARLVSLVCLLGSSDPTTIRSVPVTCISSTAVDTQSTISIFRCPAGNSLGHGDPSLTTSDQDNLQSLFWTVIYLSLVLG